MLRSRLPELEVSSAGTRARNGDPMHELTAAAAGGAGHGDHGHTSRFLQEPVLRDVDLVLTAERAHRSAVLGLRPVLLCRTFTLLEFADLAEAVRPRLSRDRLIEAVDLVVAARGQHPVDARDLPDPVAGGPKAHEQMVTSVVTAVHRIEAALCADVVTQTSPAADA